MLGFKLPRRAPKKPPTKLSKALNLFKFACLGAALGLGYRFSDPLAEKAIADVQMAKSLAVQLDQKISTANESKPESKPHDQAGVSAGLVTE